MVGEKLHDYQLQLCDYILGNIQPHLRDVSFKKTIKDWITPPTLLNYLMEGHEHQGVYQRLLLNEDDLMNLWVSFDNGPALLYQEWLPNPYLHGRFINTLREVRKALSKEASEDWSETCGKFGRLLLKDKLSLPDGIEIVKDWLWEFRRLLRAMEATDFLPCPEGKSPTPTCRQQQVKESKAESITTQDEKDDDKMREAIKKCSITATTDKLIRAAAINRSAGLKALRRLEARGEYKGFACGPKRSRHRQDRNTN